MRGLRVLRRCELPLIVVHPGDKHHLKPDPTGEVCGELPEARHYRLKA
ncbi:MAG: hypothetical protein GX493_01860 [Firmicutes bacterium]|nr:hypothetical protein [Bacillota bacterium]